MVSVERDALHILLDDTTSSEQPVKMGVHLALASPPVTGIRGSVRSISRVDWRLLNDGIMSTGVTTTLTDGDAMKKVSLPQMSSEELISTVLLATSIDSYSLNKMLTVRHKTHNKYKGHFPFENMTITRSYYKST